MNFYVGDYIELHRPGVIGDSFFKTMYKQNRHVISITNYICYGYINGYIIGIPKDKISKYHRKII